MINTSFQLISEFRILRSDGTIKLFRNIPLYKRSDMVRMRVLNAEKEIISEIQFPVKSWIRGWTDALWIQVRGTYGAGHGQGGNVTDIDGVVTDMNSTNFRANGGPGSVDTGVLVGSDAGNLAVTNYELEAQIDHGSGAGELDHAENQFTTTAIAGDECTFTVFRNFTNNSGNPVTVREVGLAHRHYYNDTKVLSLRDVEDGNGDPIEVVVADTQTLQVEYIFKITTASGYVQNVLKNLECEARDAGNGDRPAIIDIQGNPYDLDGVSGWTSALRISDSSPDSSDWSTYGIQVGSNNAAQNLADYVLGTIIADGSGANQLIRGLERFESVTVAASSSNFVTKRVFSNHSGGDITVEEAAIYCLPHPSYSTVPCMIVRTTTGSLLLQDALGEHESLDVRYTFQWNL